MKEPNQQQKMIDEPGIARMRHTIRASTLLYSAPGFILRGPIYLVFIIMITALLYSMWAKKDELVLAPLKLDRESYTVQAIGNGLVLDILAEENEPITAGDTIARVQEQIRVASNPEQEALMGQRSELQKERDKVRKDYTFRISQLEKDLFDLQSSKGTQRTSLKGRIAQIAEQLGSAQRALSSSKRQLGLARKRFATKSKLFKSKDITITEFEDAREQVHELERAVADGESRIHEIKLTKATAEEELIQIETQQREKKIIAEIKEAKENKTRDIKDLEDRITSITERLEGADTLVHGVEYEGQNTARYNSKFDGLVTAIHVKKGELVNSGAPIATVVKESAALEGKALVENKDIGRIQEGQPVQIKYFAYPYQEWGIQTGTLIDIATKPGGDSGDESKYVVRVALFKEHVQKISGKRKDLEIGLEGIAEIKTGEKRLIELVFAPVSKFFVDPEE